MNAPWIPAQVMRFQPPQGAPGPSRRGVAHCPGFSGITGRHCTALRLPSLAARAHLVQQRLRVRAPWLGGSTHPQTGHEAHHHTAGGLPAPVSTPASPTNRSRIRTGTRRTWKGTGGCPLRGFPAVRDVFAVSGVAVCLHVWVYW